MKIQCISSEYCFSKGRSWCKHIRPHDSHNSPSICFWDNMPQCEPVENSRKKKLQKLNK